MIYLRYPTGEDTYEHTRTGKNHNVRIAYADAAAEFEAGLRSKAEQFEAAHAERKLTISVIETLWGETRKLSDEIIKRVYTEMTNDSEEKPVQGKKRPWRSGYNRPEQGETGTADTDHVPVPASSLLRFTAKPGKLQGSFPGFHVLETWLLPLSGLFLPLCPFYPCESRYNRFRLYPRHTISHS
jgi:hypothetical protein